MSNLAAILEGAASVAGTVDGTPARRCKFGRTLDTLDAADRAAVLTALHGDLADVRLAKLLPVSASMLSLHRTETCICNPPGDP